MKKILIAAMVTLLAAVNVSAMELEAQDADFRISGSAENGIDVRLNVTSAAGEIIWLDSTKADESGKYSFEFCVPFLDDAQGYILIVNGTDTENVAVEGTRDSLQALASVGEDNVGGLIVKYAKRFGLDISEYDGINDKAVMHKIFKSLAITDSASVAEAFNKACGICRVNDADRGTVLDILDKYSDYLVPTYKNDISGLTQKQLQALAIAMVTKDYNSFTEFSNGYASALAQAKTPEPAYGGGSGSGGNITGGTGGFVAPPKPSGQEPEVKPEKKDPFSDLNEAEWAKESILKLYEKGVIKGREDGRFAPNDSVTREEFTAMLVRCFSLTGEAESSFSDVAEDAWYAQYVSAAVANGVVKGMADGKFGVGSKLTRQDCAVMCARILGSVSTDAKADLFADDYDIADYAKEAVYKLKELGILSGTGENKFEPNGLCTRAMTAKIIDLLGEYN